MLLPAARLLEHVDHPELLAVGYVPRDELRVAAVGINAVAVDRGRGARPLVVARVAVIVRLLPERVARVGVEALEHVLPALEIKRVHLPVRRHWAREPDPDLRLPKPLGPALRPRGGEILLRHDPGALGPAPLRPIFSASCESHR